MHELAVCQSLLTQAADVARSHGARAIAEIVVSVGPLSGVEPELLRQAFTVARAGTPAESATLTLDTPPVQVRCTACGADSIVQPQRLVCGLCEDWRTVVTGGEELHLMRLELVQEDPSHV